MKVLILAPHQDDELILCGSFLKKMADENDVYIVFTTNGDYEEKVRYIRLEESLKIADLYGISRDNFVFLGYANEYKLDGPHIYDAESDEIVYSQYGNCYTYGLSDHPEYCYLKTGEHHLYTRENFKNDLKNVLQDILPDLIFVTDVEIHPDHKANSLFFDEVMGELLKERDDFTPIILKKPEYLTAWFSMDDYSKFNNKSTKRMISDVRVNSHKSLFSNPYLKWEDRIRLPIDENTRYIDKKKNYLYKSLMIYESQNAIAHFENMNNSDVVFWQRRTDSLTYRADVMSSSGNVTFINDFKLVDSSIIKRRPVEHWNIDKSVWRPDIEDEFPRIDFKLMKPEFIDSVVIYQEYYPVSAIKKCHLIIDKSSIIDIGALKINRCNKIDLGGIKASEISFIIDEVTDKNMQPGITEIEIFRIQRKELLFAKLMIHDDFIYDYYCEDEISVPITIYEYWNDGSTRKGDFLNYNINFECDDCDVNKVIFSNGRLYGKIYARFKMMVTNKKFGNIHDEINFIPNLKNKNNRFQLVNDCQGLYYGKTADLVARLSYGEKRDNMESYVKDFFRGLICDDNSIKERTKAKIFFLGTPDHCNIGDHAITYATYALLNTMLPNYEIEEITISQFARKLPYLLRNIKKDDLIILQGGGNMGNIYWRNERIRREVISHFPKNLKVIFPETIYYEDNQEGNKDFQFSKSIYKNKNLVIFAREKKSFDIMRQAYPESTVKLIPDIVCSLAPYNIQTKRTGIGLCFRSDLEKSISEELSEKIKNELDNLQEKYLYFDMMYPSKGYIGKSNRNWIVKNKIKEIASFKYVITDRLHGMILCFITCTPCLVVAGYNHKIESFYQTWFKNVSYIHLLEQTEDIGKELHYLNDLGECLPQNMNFSDIREVLKQWELKMQ